MIKTLLFLSLAACTSSPSGATCPTSNAPADDTGMQFIATYCTDCHSTQSTNRHGAPTDINFDTIDAVRAHAADIDVVAAAGPGATNTAMPVLDTLVTAAPTQGEREMLGQFLACLENGSN